MSDITICHYKLLIQQSNNIPVLYIAVDDLIAALSQNITTQSLLKGMIELKYEQTAKSETVEII